MSKLIQYIREERKLRSEREEEDKEWQREMGIIRFSDAEQMAFFTYQDLEDQILGVRHFYADMRRSTGDTEKMHGDVAGERDRQLTLADEIRNEAIAGRMSIMDSFPGIMRHPLYKILPEEIMVGH
tara:strand:- start:631 stop:1008 length:378 start_codon:yes stop_codon:yes gene_type:complete